MLSPHEISTLLLIQRAPHEVELLSHSTTHLRRDALIEIEHLPSGAPLPLLTQKGQDVLKRLDASWNHNAADRDESE